MRDETYSAFQSLFENAASLRLGRGAKATSST
jgi:hypothetical protein